MTLLLIGGIPLLVIISATWMWVYVASGDLDLVGLLGTSNKGQLVTPPQQLTSLQLAGLQSEDFVSVDGSGKWTMLVPGGADCDQTCVDTLYLTRQVRTAIGPDAGRIRRVYLNLDGRTNSVAVQLILEQHPQMETVVASRVAVLELLVAAGIPDVLELPGVWFVVDPQGWMMMYYSAEHSYKDPISDLKFLLRNTGE